MRLLDYQQKLLNLERQFEKSKENLAIEFAEANNPYKEGDIFEDHIGKVKVKKIGVTIQNGIPSCVYSGIELKKDGTPMKKQTKRGAYQTNEKK